jgi:hypothetical protein
MSEQRRESSSGRKFPIRVIKFSREDCPFSNRDHTWQQFHTFRNAVLDILSSYGGVGPSGKMPIIENYDCMLHDPEPGASKPEFFVVDDDMYGLSVRIEADWTMAKPVLLEELATLLKTCPEWCVYFALKKGGLFIFHDRILYEGTFFSGCNCIEDIYHRCTSGTETDAPPREETDA